MTARPGPARGRAPPPAGGAPPRGPRARSGTCPATPACRSAAPRPRSPSSTRPARHTVPWLPFPAIVASTAPSSRGADPAGGRLPPLRLDQEPDSEPSAGVAGWLPSDYPMWVWQKAGCQLRDRTYSREALLPGAGGEASQLLSVWPHDTATHQSVGLAEGSRI